MRNFLSPIFLSQMRSICRYCGVHVRKQAPGFHYQMMGGEHIYWGFVTYRERDCHKKRGVHFEETDTLGDILKHV